MTYKESVHRAINLAKKYNEHYFVVAESPKEFDVANSFDLETFFLGSTPVFCTDEVNIDA